MNETHLPTSLHGCLADPWGMLWFRLCLWDKLQDYGLIKQQPNKAKPNSIYIFIWNYYIAQYADITQNFRNIILKYYTK